MAIWQHRQRVLGIYSPRMRRNSYLKTSGQKSDPAIRFGDLDFLYDRCISTTERRFCATTSHDLVTLTFDLLTLRVFHVQCFSCPTHTSIFIILRLSVTELRLMNIWSHFRYLKQSLRMRSITWPVHRRSPKTTRNNFFDPNLPIHYTTFMRLPWRLRVVYIWASACGFRSQKSPVKIGPRNGGFSEI